MTKQIKIKTELGTFLSWDEAYFAAWLEEVGKAGYIKQFAYEPYPLIISEGMKNVYTEHIQLKKSSRAVEKEQTIIRPSEYTPDFLIEWDEEAQGIFFDLLNGGRKIEKPFIAHSDDEVTYSLVEVKPVFDRHNMTRLFVNNQKVIWERFEKYINLIKIDELFRDTFTPKAYLTAPKGGKRKPKWKVITLNQYLK